MLQLSDRDVMVLGSIYNTAKTLEKLANKEHPEKEAN